MLYVWYAVVHAEVPVAKEKLKLSLKAEEVGKRGFVFPFAPCWRLTIAETSSHSPSLRNHVLWSDEWIDRRLAHQCTRKVQ